MKKPFIELTDSQYKKKWYINLNTVIFIRPQNSGAVLHTLDNGNRHTISVDEDYFHVKNLIDTKCANG